MNDQAQDMALNFSAEITQYLMPNGKRIKSQTDLPISIKDDYDDMIKHGCRLEAEVLSTGNVSVTISDGEEDLEIEIIENGPEVRKAIIDMIRRKPWKL